MGLKGLKFPEQAISEIEQLQSSAREQLSNERNVDKYDEIHPIFKNNTAVFSVAILEYIDKWEQAKASQTPGKLKIRVEQIKKLLKRVRRKKWLSEEVRGYNI